MPDLYEGRVFDAYDPAMAWAEQLGNEALLERGLAAIADVADGFVVGGFSQGSSVAVFVATRRRVLGVLQLSGLNIVDWFGANAAWVRHEGARDEQLRRLEGRLMAVT
ncbi:MAG: hypothetical protein ACR2MN_01730 [Acidimicrobiales bacterium]